MSSNPEFYTLTKEQARRFILAHQGLCPPRRFEGNAGIMEFIRRVGCIQFDPLDVAGRNPELVLQSRVAGFRPAMLRELLYQDRQLLDGWDKMMSIYAIDDWPYFKRRRDSDRKALEGKVAAVLSDVRKAIRERGPLSSLELHFNETVDWPWAPTRLSRAALESMYFWGELVIHHKVHSRKVYDFAARHLSDDLLTAPDPNQSIPEYRDWHIKRRIGSIGLLWGRSSDAWLGIPGVKSKERAVSLNRLVKNHQITAVRVEGIEHPFYLRNEEIPLLNQVSGSTKPSARAAIIAPLDNLLWDRRLVKELFDFDYRWEVYTPVAERRYGYYVLPILYGDCFIARFEPWRDKKNSRLVVKNWWWEPGVKPTKAVREALAQCFREFKVYLETESLQIDAQVIQDQGLDWLESS